MLAVVYFTKYFKHYLLGRFFIVRSDHGSLRWLSKFKEPEGQVQRLLEQLSQFDYQLIHRAGIKHGNAYFMSRVAKGDNTVCRQCEMPFTTTNIDGEKVDSMLRDVVQTYIIHIPPLFEYDEDAEEEIQEIIAHDETDNEQSPRPTLKVNEDVKQTNQNKLNRSLNRKVCLQLRNQGKHKRMMNQLDMFYI